MGRNEWTGREIEFLIKNYEQDSKSTIDKLCTRHSRESIRKKAYSLGLKRNLGGKWTEDEILILKNEYRSGKDLSELLPRHSLDAIRKKAYSLGL